MGICNRIHRLQRNKTTRQKKISWRHSAILNKCKYYLAKKLEIDSKSESESLFRNHWLFESLNNTSLLTPTQSTQTLIYKGLFLFTMIFKEN